MMNSQIISRFTHKHRYTIIALGIYHIVFFINMIFEQNHLTQIFDAGLVRLFLMCEMVLIFLANSSYLHWSRGQEPDTDLRPLINLIYCLFWALFFAGLIFILIWIGKTVDNNGMIQFSKTRLWTSWTMVCGLWVTLSVYLTYGINKIHTHIDNNNIDIIYNLLRTLCHSSFMVINVYPWIYIVLINKY